ncbi:MAG TPA: hypothetical protein VH743_14695 [Beijerinckiaceae bacterium]|jgi:hypothetical protein
MAKSAALGQAGAAADLTIRSPRRGCGRDGSGLGPWRRNNALEAQRALALHGKRLPMFGHSFELLANVAGNNPSSQIAAFRSLLSILLDCFHWRFRAAAHRAAKPDSKGQFPKEGQLRISTEFLKLLLRMAAGLNARQKMGRGYSFSGLAGT